MAKKYYWLKLQKDFFKRHDIRIVENMPNGKDYVLFYMKLLVESISHEGELRFSETIPYNEDMLSTITNTNIDIVRSAVKLFCELDLMAFMEDGTLHMKDVQKMIGTQTEWAEKKRVYRDKKKQIGQKEDMSYKSKSLELEKELDIEKDNTGGKRFKKPTVIEVSEYCKERNNNIKADHFFDYYQSKGWMIGKNKMKDWKSAVRTWERNNFKADKPDNFKGKQNFEF